MAWFPCCCGDCGICCLSTLNELLVSFQGAFPSGVDPTICACFNKAWYLGTGDFVVTKTSTPCDTVTGADFSCYWSYIGTACGTAPLQIIPTICVTMYRMSGDTNCSWRVKATLEGGLCPGQFVLLIGDETVPVATGDCEGAAFAASYDSSSGTWPTNSMTDPLTATLSGV